MSTRACIGGAGPIDGQGVAAITAITDIGPFLGAECTVDGRAIATDTAVNADGLTRAIAA